MNAFLVPFLVLVAALLGSAAFYPDIDATGRNLVYHDQVNVPESGRVRIPMHTSGLTAGVRLYVYGEPTAHTVPEHSHGEHGHGFIGWDYYPGWFIELSEASAAGGIAPDFVEPSFVGTGSMPIPSTIPKDLRIYIDGVDHTVALGGPWGSGSAFETGILDLTPLIGVPGEHDIELEVGSSGGLLIYNVYVR